MVDRPLSQADAVLINGAAQICHTTIHDPERQAMVIDCLREAVNSANWDHPISGPLVSKVRNLLDDLRDKKEPLHRRYAFEVGEIQAALVPIFEWRMGVSLELFREGRSAA